MESKQEIINEDSKLIASVDAGSAESTKIAETDTTTNTKKCAHFCALVRHGERIDYTKEVNPHNLKNPLDPSLSSLGLSQAERTGEFFAKYCPKKTSSISTDENFHHGFDTYVIETSPMLRCIQTAAKIASKLGVKKIKINYMATEFLNEGLYPSGCPLSKIEFAQVMKISRQDRPPQMLKFKQDN